MDVEQAIGIALDRARTTPEREAMMFIFGTHGEPYQVEFATKSIAYGLIAMLGEGLAFLRPECVVLMVVKESDYWVWAGTRDRQRISRRVPFSFDDGVVLFDEPVGDNQLALFPLDLFWDGVFKEEV